MNRLVRFTEAELWDAFREGDEEAFAYLYRTFSPILYSYGFHLCRQQVVTEDCIQDLFIHLHQHRAQLGPTNSIKFYLYRSLRRRIADKAQSSSRFVSEEDAETQPEFTLDMPAESGLINDQTLSEQKRKLEYLINRLPKRQKEALYLLYYEELSYPEIAQLMGLEVKSVYNLIYNSLVSLRAYIAEQNVQFFSVLLWLCWL